ncbi:prolipoprotein diacylglyceryl transferase family protein [Enterobacteriaceae endosymbiont of Donacia versicolorea]|uniref:prolipoprotein diacylglyceryl transferase family protein n=1 Tax=Enterobacteriaceae endosymbiont of Donacia versicolorea TaxID=2675788 RepID=UPI001FE89E67|nr:prolipoprotein diacylglyceryl transferase family protein [Enterobacteriaceae endosymbiont of Donacia versicolorea]
MNTKYFLFPNINPIFLKINKINIYWYSILYLINFLFIINIFKIKNIKKNNNLLYYCFIGLLLGGKIGYTLFYHISDFIKNPIILIKLWEGGMSFFGGLIGIIIVLVIYSYKKKKIFYY